MYAPLIFYWGRKQGLNATDAADLVQDVLSTLVLKLPAFEYDATQRFRGWLWTVTVNRARDMHRRQAVRPTDGMDATMQLASGPSETEAFDEAEYRGFVCKRALEVMQSEFPARQWQACWQLVVDGRRGREIAKDLGISESAVYVAKCRIMKRLREELAGLFD